MYAGRVFGSRRTSTDARFPSEHEEAARRQRGLAQRICLLDETIEGADTEDNDARVTYAVQGTTDRVYDVVVSQHGKTWSCTCPDHLQRHRDCKHIYFVRDRALAPHVARLIQTAPDTSPVAAVWSVARSGMFASAFGRARLPPLISDDRDGAKEDTMVVMPEAIAPQYRSVVGTTSARQQYLDAKQHRSASATPAQGEDALVAAEPLRRPIDGQACGICLDDMEASERLLYCETSCGNAVHTECYDRWAASALARHFDAAPWVPTCVYCRQTMSHAAKTAAITQSVPQSQQPDYITIVDQPARLYGTCSSSSSSSDDCDSDSDCSSSSSSSSDDSCNYCSSDSDCGCG